LFYYSEVLSPVIQHNLSYGFTIPDSNPQTYVFVDSLGQVKVSTVRQGPFEYKGYQFTEFVFDKKHPKYTIYDVFNAQYIGSRKPDQGNDYDSLQEDEEEEENAGWVFLMLLALVTCCGAFWFLLCKSRQFNRTDSLSQSGYHRAPSSHLGRPASRRPTTNRANTTQVDRSRSKSESRRPIQRRDSRRQY